MTEKEFINKIRGFRQIKPSQDWVVLVKKRIFEQEDSVIMRQCEKEKAISRADGNFTDGNLAHNGFSATSVFDRIKIVFSHKLAFASVLSLIILFGLFGFAQNSLPGDPLFSLKKIAEDSQSVLISRKDQSNYDFEMAQRRLEDLIKVAQRNSVKNLAPAINEYQANISKVADNLAREKDRKKVKEMVIKMTELQSKESEVKSYGVEIGDNKELEKVYAQKIIETLEPLIEDLKNRDLTEEQKKDLMEAEKDLANKNYEQALVKLLYINR
jgi:hypothetical protein